MVILLVCGPHLPSPISIYKVNAPGLFPNPARLMVIGTPISLRRPTPFLKGQAALRRVAEPRKLLLNCCCHKAPLGALPPTRCVAEACGVGRGCRGLGHPIRRWLHGGELKLCCVLALCGRWLRPLLGQQMTPPTSHRPKAGRPSDASSSRTGLRAGASSYVKVRTVPQAAVQLLMRHAQA